MIDGFIESQGVKIHYLASEFRKQRKSILFVPGIMMPAWIWEKQLTYFSKEYNVVAIEPRSQGDSEQSCEGHYAFSLAKDIQSVVNALDLQQLVVVGWSIGVPQVLNYAVHFGLKRIAGLVFVDGIVGADSSVPFYQSMVDLWIQFQMDRIPNTEKFIRTIFKKPQEEIYLKKLYEVAIRTPTSTVMTLINNYILQDFRTLLPGVAATTLIATIEGPRLDYMRKMNSLLPNSRLEIFQSAGHALFVDQPENFNLALEGFIKTL